MPPSFRFSVKHICRTLRLFPHTNNTWHSQLADEAVDFAFAPPRVALGQHYRLGEWAFLHQPLELPGGDLKAPGHFFWCQQDDRVCCREIHFHACVPPTVPL